VEAMPNLQYLNVLGTHGKSFGFWVGGVLVGRVPLATRTIMVGGKHIGTSM